MDVQEREAFAKAWLNGWNERDLERILSHYADDVEFQSPFAVYLLGEEWRTNGVLASSAIGMFMSLILPWSKKPMPLLLEYDGNRGTVVPSMKLVYLPRVCPHFNYESDLGDPFWKISKSNEQWTVGRRHDGQSKVLDTDAQSNQVGDFRDGFTETVSLAREAPDPYSEFNYLTAKRP